MKRSLLKVKLNIMNQPIQFDGNFLELHGLRLEHHLYKIAARERFNDIASFGRTLTEVLHHTFTRMEFFSIKFIQNSLNVLASNFQIFALILIDLTLRPITTMLFVRLQGKLNESTIGKD